MSKKVFNEKKYQKTRKILNIIGISWIVGVIIISVTLTCFGAYNANKAKKALTDAANAAAETALSLPVVTPTDTSIDISEQPYDLSSYTGPKTQTELDAAVAAIEAQHTIAMGQDGWLQDRSTASRAISDLTMDFNVYKSKKETNDDWVRRETSDQIKEAKNTVAEAVDSVTAASKNILSGFSGTSDIVIGGMSLVALVGVVIVTILCCIPGVILLFIANSRAIYGFTAQSTVPVAKESTEQMSPAFGTVAKDITSGIVSGLAGKKKVSAKKKRK